VDWPGTIRRTWYEVAETLLVALYINSSIVNPRKTFQVLARSCTGSWVGTYGSSSGQAKLGMILELQKFLY
jgi:hypothetical protein